MTQNLMSLTIFSVLTGLALRVPAIAYPQIAHFHDRPVPGTQTTSADTSASNAVTASMGGALVESLHLEMSPVRTRSAGDEARAGKVLAELRRGSPDTPTIG